MVLPNIFGVANRQLKWSEQLGPKAPEVSFPVGVVDLSVPLNFEIACRCDSTDACIINTACSHFTDEWADKCLCLSSGLSSSYPTATAANEQHKCE